MSSGKEEYGDIFDRPHHVSSKRPQMSRLNRAAQFSPFAALTGYGALVDESARVTDVKIEKADDDLARIDRKLQLLQSHLSEDPEITILYFEPDRRKAGGAYIERSGTVKKIDTIHHILWMKSGIKIPLDDILDITGTLFEQLPDSI
jgi:hypothetical protein